MSFSRVPVLDLALARDPASKPAFLADLRRAILEVGFLYIKNTGIDPALTKRVIDQAHAFFALPQDRKLEVQMVREKSFLGYNLLGGETTANDTDWREQLDLSTPHPVPGADAPLYHNLLAPNQWPSTANLPDFRATYEEYIALMSTLSISFTNLIAEALDLPSSAFDRFFDADQQHKLKIIRYPDASQLDAASAAAATPPNGTTNGTNGTTNGVTGTNGATATNGMTTDKPAHISPNGIPEGWRQGVGPHKDSMLTSYLLQATAHAGLQAQNVQGAWIDVPPIDGTLVVAIGQGLEALTQGVCASTTHRVLSPPAGAGARLSVPFFQGVSYDATFESVDVPAHVRDQKRAMVQRDGGARLDDVEFTFVKGKFHHLGEATLYNRAKSHPDVAQRWYPELWKEICRDRDDAQRATLKANADPAPTAPAAAAAAAAPVPAH